MKKRVLSIFLALTLIFAFSAPSFAVNYSDLNGHWAKDYMESIASKGFLNGYSDGTMKPDKNLTTCEALIVLSRFYSLTDIQSEMIRSDYEEIVKQTVSSSYSWAYRNFEVCLAAGIITRDELKSMNLASEIQKELLSLYLVRALQLSAEADNLANTQLQFTDVSKISSNCLGSVAMLTSLKIVNGDNNNKFSPKSSVTRAVASAMVYRSLSYLNQNSKTLYIDAYNGVTRNEGIITSIKGSNVYICGYDGLTRNYLVQSNSSVTINGEAKALTSSYIGCYAKVTLKNGLVKSISIQNDSSVKWIQGAVNSVSISSYNLIYIRDLNDMSVKSYSVSSNALVYRDSVASTISSIQTNDFVTLKCINGVVTEIRAISSITELNGTISKISYGTTVTIDIVDQNNVLYSFAFDISSLPSIVRGGKTISVDSLKVGTNVSVKFDKCKVSVITAKGSGNTVTGELVSYTASTSGITWIIKTDKDTETYTLDENAIAYSGNNTIPLSNIHVGDQVSVVVYQNVITEISQISSTSSSTKVTGSVLQVDLNNKVITVLSPSDKLIYIKTNSVVSVIDSKTGYTANMSSIAINSKITVYGAYSNTKNFDAKSIIIE